MLLAAQIVAVTGTVALVTLGGIVGRNLAPSTSLATLPLSLLAVGTAVSTVFASWTQSRIGRRRGLALGAVIGCAGACGAVAATAGASFALFCAAAMMLGCANAFAQQYRFAAAESVPAASAGHAISVVLAGSMAGGVLGPALAARGELWIAGAPFGGVFAVVAGCHLTAAVLLLLWLRNTQPGPSAEVQGSVRPLRQIARSRQFVVAVLGAATGHGVMVFVMTAAPLAMHVVDAHSLASTAAVVQAHVLAMYAPSLVTGALMNRFGSRRLMLAGALVLAVTIAAGFTGREVLHYGIAMVALGVGWNFLYIGGTTLLAETHRPAERFRVQAVNDLSVFGVSAIGSLTAGAVMLAFGWNAVLGASAPAIVLALAALTWARPAERRAADRH